VTECAEFLFCIRGPGFKYRFMTVFVVFLCPSRKMLGCGTREA